MNKKRIGTMAVAAMLIVGILSGCGKKFDATAYTKAVLDVSYKNQTEQYMELTEESKEDANAIFEENLDATMEAFKTLGLTEELEAKYKELFVSIVKEVRYTVGEAEETEDKNFTVDVSIEPITLFEDTYEEFQTKATEYTTKLTNDVMAGAEVPTQEEMQEKVYQIYYEILKAEVDAGLKYGEKETVTVHVNKNEDNIYEIPESDMTDIDSKMISQNLM